MTLEIFTSANLAYLAQASVLAESVRRHAPEARLTLALIDAFPESGSANARRLQSDLFDAVVTVEEVIGSDHESWMFGYDVVEACTAVKGRALVELLNRGNPVLYLDPDTALFGPLFDVEKALSDTSVLLTPHLLEPVDPESPAIEDEISCLTHGAYNFGMFGVSPCDEGRRFATWWSSRLEEHCVDEIGRGLFVDQRWGDLIPSFFPDCCIFRHAGVNFASWNMDQRDLSVDDRGDYLVNGDPLVMFHFTKGLGIGFEISKLKMANNPFVADLWRWYLERVEFFSTDLEPTRWSYGFYRDGAPIPKSDRVIYREIAPNDRPRDPFSGTWRLSGGTCS
jgi:hypothetical protein